jgi:hypothetical protein
MHTLQVDVRSTIWWRVTLRRFPLPVILLIVWVFLFATQRIIDIPGWLPYVALFLPGAVQRLNRRHVLLAAIFGGLAYFAGRIESYLRLSELPSFSFWAFPATTMVLAGVSEWWLRSDRNRKRLVIMISTCGTAAMLAALVLQPLRFMDCRLLIPNLDGSSTFYSLDGVLWFPLIGLLTWTAIPLADRVASLDNTSDWRRLLWIPLATLVFYVGFYAHLIFYPARWSLEGNGPFSRSYGAVLLAWRNTESDISALWDAVESADWTRDPPDWEYGDPDYRESCISHLEKRDPASTARRLAEMLKSHPSERLAKVAAPRVAEYQIYDAVPTLLRYSNSEDALLKMSVPQVAWPLMFNAAVHQQMNHQPPAQPLAQQFVRPEWIDVEPSPVNLSLPDDVREKLSQLLGEYDGRTLDEWERHYDLVIHDRPTPLTPELSAQANRVISAKRVYWQTLDMAYEIRRRRVFRLWMNKLKAAGYERQSAIMEDVAKASQGQSRIRVPDLPHEDFEAMSSYLQEARAEIPMPPVDFNVPRVEGLEQEIARYRALVEKDFAAEFPDQPMKSITPPSRPAL